MLFTRLLNTFLLISNTTIPDTETTPRAIGLFTKFVFTVWMDDQIIYVGMAIRIIQFIAVGFVLCIVPYFSFSLFKKFKSS